MKALERFGLPDCFIKMISEIYSSRDFFVSECGVNSEVRGQSFGISQGCPLSPYLFVILMSVLLRDAQDDLSSKYGISLPHGVISELIYADDTLLVGSHAGTIQRFLHCIIERGQEYGLELNWQKLELLSARSGGTINTTDGKPLQAKPSIIYLGSSVAADGDVTSEMLRRMGLAQKEFELLRRVWSHTRLSAKEKYRIYEACVISRLLYGLQVLCLGQAALRRLDGFHARCVRKILGIQHAYWSRISNETVLERMQAPKLSALLLEQQLLFLGKLARRPVFCPVRQFAFEPDLSMKSPDIIRRRGRPRAEWTIEIFKKVKAIFPDDNDFRVCVSDPLQWRRRVREFCRAKSLR